MDWCAVEQEAVCAVLLASKQGLAGEGLYPLPSLYSCFPSELFLSCFQIIFLVFRDVAP